MPMVSHNYKVYSRIAGGFIFVTSTSLGISVTRKIRDLEQSLAVLSLRIERSVMFFTNSNGFFMCRDFFAGNLEQAKTYPDQRKKVQLTA